MTTKTTETPTETAARLEREARELRARAEEEALEAARREYWAHESARRAAEQAAEVATTKGIAALQGQLSTLDPATLLSRIRDAERALRGAVGADAMIAQTVLDDWRREIEAEAEQERARWRALYTGLQTRESAAAKPVVRDLPTDIESVRDQLIVGAGPNARLVLDGWRIAPGRVLPADHPVRAALEAHVAAQAEARRQNPIIDPRYGLYLLPIDRGLAGACDACPFDAIEVAALAGPRVAYGWLAREGLEDHAPSRQSMSGETYVLTTTVETFDRIHGGAGRAQLAAWWQTQSTTEEAAE